MLSILTPGNDPPVEASTPEVITPEVMTPEVPPSPEISLADESTSEEDSRPLEPEPASEAETLEEFEIVLGKRQLAGVLFIAIVGLVVFVALSYLAGKGASPVIVKTVETPYVAPAPVHAPVVETAPVPQIPVATVALPESPVTADPDIPIYEEPRKGATYLQMGAVEKGIAIIFAEGLRKHGLRAFVAPGPNEKIFRVLIGPLADPKAYERAKSTIDQIGLTTFGRRYEQ